MQKKNLISRKRIYKEREFLKRNFGERNSILEQLFDRTALWSRRF